MYVCVRGQRGVNEESWLVQRERETLTNTYMLFSQEEYDLKVNMPGYTAGSDATDMRTERQHETVDTPRERRRAR